MTDTKAQGTVAALLKHGGQTYAEQAGIRLADKPAPLYQLLVLATLLSARISADVAVAAARELREAGFTMPQHMRDATWQQRVDALGRGRYRRYDEKTSTELGDGAQLLIERYDGDLRRLAAESGRQPDEASKSLQQFPGIGPAGVDIFLREVQDRWSWLRPYIDRRVIQGAKAVGISGDVRQLFDAVGDQAARLSAALVRVTLDDDVADAVRKATS